DLAGVTREELRSAPELVFTPERMDVAHRFEILKIDPAKLSPALVDHYMPRLVGYRLYDRLAEAFEKVGYSDNLEHTWKAGVQGATLAGRKDIAQRLIDVRKPHGLTEDEWPPAVSFLLMEDDAERCLAFVEDTIRKALESGHMPPLVRLAFALLVSKHPALGIALARGVMPFVPPEDVSQLMEYLLRARDRLNLSPDDLISEVLDMQSIQDIEDSDAS